MGIFGIVTYRILFFSEKDGKTYSILVRGLSKNQATNATIVVIVSATSDTFKEEALALFMFFDFYEQL